MIIDRYITREIGKPFVLGTSLLMLVFTGFTAAIKLGDAADGLLEPGMVARLIGLSTVVALEVLLPTALYLSVIAGISRLYRDSEMAALRAAGVSEWRILRALTGFALLVALLAGAISVFGRPWAYRESYRLEAEASAEFDVRRITPGRFLDLQGGKYVLFTRAVDPDDGRLDDVFLQSERAGRLQVIRARSASLPPVSFGEPREFEFRQGYAYLLDRQGRRDISLKFNRLVIHIPPQQPDRDYRRKAEPTLSLAHSDAPKDVAEFQLRLSTPLSTLLLVALAVPLARSTPRQGRHNNFVLAILVYIGLFNLVNLARSRVEDGSIGPTPGIWWAFALPLALFVLLMALPAWRLRRTRK